MIRYLCLFSGLSAASVAWEPLGWECVGFAEIEKFPCAVLKHYWPQVPNLGNISAITRDQIEALGHIDVVVMGFPCQDLSQAGSKKGLNNADGSVTRSGLVYDALRIVEWARARWTVGENVPGCFSVNGGKEFATLAGIMAGCQFDVPRNGWLNAGAALGPNGLVEWATLDAQYFGVPQTRRRVFFIRDSGDWQNRPPTLLVSESMSRDPLPRREARQDAPSGPDGGTAGDGGLECGEAGEEISEFTAEVAKTIGSGYGDAGSRDGTDCAGSYIVARCLNAGGQGRQDAESETLIPCIGEVSAPLRASAGRRGGLQDQGGSDGLVVSFSRDRGDDGRGESRNGHVTEEIAGAMETVKAPRIAHMRTVRKLTPLECERLQGFPDGFTAIKYRGSIAKDSPRYKALGNSMAVPVMAHIGRAIVTALSYQEKA